MVQNQLTDKSALLAFVAIIIVAICLIEPVSAGLKVAGSYYVSNVSPGSTQVHQMTVSTRMEDPPMDISVEVRGFCQSPDRSYAACDPGTDLPYSAVPFISVDRSSFHLDPGQSQVVTATIRVPSTVGSGGRYAMIFVKTAPMGSGSTGFVTAINVPVFLTIAGTQATVSGNITDLTIGKVVAGQPILVTTGFQNTGNHHYGKVRNEVELRDASGTVLTSAQSETSPLALIPASLVKFTLPVTEGLPAGQYIVHSRVFQDLNLLDERSISLTIEAPHVPPFQETSLIIRPSSAATLHTQDGRITIEFPQGSVISEANITVRPISQDRLPKSPENTRHAVTCFQVDGLPGLLSRDASIAVQYTSDDRDAAGGDVGKLSLARWDEGENRWTVLPTNLDNTRNTLTTTTNRLSIWSVLVAEEVKPAATEIPGFTCLNTILGIGVMLILSGIYAMTRSRK